jgi:hypothetical protein
VGNSSTRASVAATCNLAGKRRNDCWILSWVSRCTKGSGCGTPAGSAGKLFSVRLRRKWSIAKKIFVLAELEEIVKVLDAEADIKELFVAKIHQSQTHKEPLYKNPA